MYVYTRAPEEIEGAYIYVCVYTPRELLSHSVSGFALCRSLYALRGRSLTIYARLRAQAFAARRSIYVCIRIGVGIVGQHRSCVCVF